VTLKSFVWISSKNSASVIDSSQYPTFLSTRQESTVHSSYLLCFVRDQLLAEQLGLEDLLETRTRKFGAKNVLVLGRTFVGCRGRDRSGRTPVGRRRRQVVFRRGGGGKPGAVLRTGTNRRHHLHAKNVLRCAKAFFTSFRNFV
jgi:hypothetical protein